MSPRQNEFAGEKKHQYENIFNINIAQAPFEEIK